MKALLKKFTPPLVKATNSYKINRLNDHVQAEATRLTDLHEETKRLLGEKAQEASILVEEKDKILSKIEELKNEVTRRGEDLTKARESFKQDVAHVLLLNSLS